MSTTLDIYTDGSCRRNSTGAWGYIIYQDGNAIYKDAAIEYNTTNNRMELMALIRACQTAAALYPNMEFNIYSDSAYCLNCLFEGWYHNWMRNNWRTSTKAPVKNQDLWELLVPWFDNAQFHFFKVKGHANSIMNNEVDELVEGLTAANLHNQLDKNLLNNEV